MAGLVTRMFIVIGLDTGALLTFESRKAFDTFLWDIYKDGFGVSERDRVAWFTYNV